MNVDLNVPSEKDLNEPLALDARNWNTQGAIWWTQWMSWMKYECQIKVIRSYALKYEHNASVAKDCGWMLWRKLDEGSKGF